MSPTVLFGHRVLGHITGLPYPDHPDARKHLEARIKAQDIPVEIDVLDTSTGAFGILTHQDVVELKKNTQEMKYTPPDGKEGLAFKQMIGPETLKINFRFSTDEQGFVELTDIRPVQPGPENDQSVRAFSRAVLEGSEDG